MPPLGVILFNRAAFGPRPGDLAAFDALGGDDDTRLAAWVAEQLAPDPDESNDTELYERRTGANSHPDPGFTTLDKTLQQLWVDHRLGNVEAYRPVYETRLLTMMRMTYSKWQLREVLADFWMNHFNVYGLETYTRETMVHWDRDVIRPNIFGNFRTLLEATARSTTMLYYLDNYTNIDGGPNENYGRELIELHTLGAMHYIGTGSQASVAPGDLWPAGAPNAGNPAPAGYVDADVYETARCLTGWGVNPSTGEFLYTDENHDRFQKAVLSFGFINIPADQAPEHDALDIFDLLAAHPGTGVHLATKLCRRLIGDVPPPALVAQVAQIFTLAWQDSDQLAQVYEAILLSDDFKATWGEKMKRPTEHAISLLRAADADWFFGFSNPALATIDPDTNSLLYRLSLAGNALFSHVPPDGFSDVQTSWTGTNPRVQSWRNAAWLIDQDIDGSSGTDDFRLDVITQTITAGISTPTAIVDYWVDRLLGRTIDSLDRDTLISFMAAGANPANPLNLGVVNSAHRRRLRMLVGLIAMSPEFFLK